MEMSAVFLQVNTRGSAMEMSQGYVCNPSSSRERDAASKRYGNAPSVTAL